MRPRMILAAKRAAATRTAANANTTISADSVTPVNVAIATTAVTITTLNRSADSTVADATAAGAVAHAMADMTAADAIAHAMADAMAPDADWTADATGADTNATGTMAPSADLTADTTAPDADTATADAVAADAANTNANLAANATAAYANVTANAVAHAMATASSRTAIPTQMKAATTRRQIRTNKRTDAKLAAATATTNLADTAAPVSTTPAATTIVTEIVAVAAKATAANGMAEPAAMATTNRTTNFTPAAASTSQATIVAADDSFDSEEEQDDEYELIDNHDFDFMYDENSYRQETPSGTYAPPAANQHETAQPTAPTPTVAETSHNPLPSPPATTSEQLGTLVATLGGRQSLRNVLVTESGIPKTTKERHHTGKKDPFSIPPRFEARIAAGIMEALDRLQLGLGTVPVPFHGTKELSENTLRFYQKHMRGIQYFCALIGDYESLLMLLECPPTPICPSMKPSTLASFIRFKRFPPNTPLLDAHGNPVLDVFGDAITCQGGWNDPGSANGFLSVMGGIHRSRNQQGPYVSDCQHCLEYERTTRTDASIINEANATRREEKCSAHKYHPIIYRMGNPLNSSTVHDTLQNSTKAAATYTPNGDTGLTPWELLDVRRRLLSGNSLWELMIWVMILIGSKLFLRSAELLDLQFDSNLEQNCLNWDLTVIQDSFIEGLCFKIKGKKDQQPIQLILWADHENPALCPIRHLLLYIHLSGLKSGYLFPSAEFWKQPDRGSHCSHEDKLTYSSFQQYFQQLCEAVIKRDGKFGSHSIRKTGYVLAIWGGGNECEEVQAGCGFPP
ncbi:hypothetical protein DFJ73DRAFT_961925 [Zopfochytrium polystomum]|nr:hypothetical protein DFJ73DRAFT_961925 [Zopfochytrium polystomum]